MRIAILGNSGSGKSTLATWLAGRTGAPRLDLDTVAWEPGQVAVARPEELAQADVRRFCAASPSWIIEGCYERLVEAALAFGPRLVYLNPGEAQCIANCRTRPWEPHKYASKDEQDARLAFLLDWVAQHYHGDGAMSLRAHQALFARYAGPKHELNRLPCLAPPSAELLAWIA
jgi:adenylate kinase family enzyme